MAHVDDTQFGALLDTLQSLDNDARAQAEVRLEIIGSKINKMWITEKNVLRREKKKILIRDDDSYGEVFPRLLRVSLMRSAREGAVGATY